MAISSISKHFGTAVRNRRMAAGLSQEMLVQRAGLHPTYVSVVERAVRNPTLDVSAGIAEALKIGLPELLEEAQQHRWNSVRKRPPISSHWEAIHRQKHERLHRTP